MWVPVAMHALSPPSPTAAPLDVSVAPWETKGAGAPQTDPAGEDIWAEHLHPSLLFLPLKNLRVDVVQGGRHCLTSVMIFRRPPLEEESGSLRGPQGPFRVFSPSGTCYANAWWTHSK